MVERSGSLDAVFGALSDPTRRHILRRLARKNMSVGEVAEAYEMSFAAVAKHLDVLESAGLVSKTRQGRQQIVALTPAALRAASAHLEFYRDLWESRLDSLGEFLQSINNRKGRS